MWFCVWGKLCNLRVLWFPVACWFRVGRNKGNKNDIFLSRVKQLTSLCVALYEQIGQTNNKKTRKTI